jgi:uncharacterized protein YkwD
MKLTDAALALGVVLLSGGCGSEEFSEAGTGGTHASGGAAGNAAGGAAGNAAGGTAGNAAGGSTSTGGSTGTGGSTSTGGSTGTGGSTSTGGSTGTGGGTSCPGADTGVCGDDGSGWPSASQNFECKVIEFLNAKRATGVQCGNTWAPGGPPVVRDKDLTANARAHAKFMADQSSVTFDENGTPAGDWSVKNYCGKYITAEIGGGQSDPSTFFMEQLNIESECIKLMAAGAKGVGVGYYTDATGTSVHMWTLVLGNLP